MCECGCASSRLFHVRLAQRDPKWTYTMALHPGCSDCETGPAFMLERYSKEDARTMDIHHLPIAEFDSGGVHFIPGVEPDALLAALRGSGIEADDLDVVVTTSDVASCLSEAVRKTAEQYQQRKATRV